jgi:hypothetical protein
VHLHATSGRLDDVAGVAIERNDILVPPGYVALSLFPAPRGAVPSSLAVGH